MIPMTERKAKELFDQYVKAEMAGNDTQAQDLESQLNKGGWYIKSAGGGTVAIEKQPWFSGGGVDSDYSPVEKDYTGYKADNDSPNRGIWIALGITAGVAALILLTVFLIKRYKRSANLKQNVIPKRV